jgi:hypothetical protein
MIERIVTGGQSGADLAGWRAAKAAGIACYGWMPKGFLTEDGPRPEYAGLYGAREHSSKEYPPRTRANVAENCVVLWFGDPRSRGGKLTLGCARERGVFTYVIESPRSEWGSDAVARHVLNAFEQQRYFDWITIHQRNSLMVAGNRESSSPGIGRWVEEFVGEVIVIAREIQSR